MKLIDNNKEFELRKLANDLTYRINSSIGVTERDIVVNNCEIITAIEVYFLVNNHVVSDGEDVVRCEFEKLGLNFIRMDNDAWCGEIKRRLYFTV